MFLEDSGFSFDVTLEACSLISWSRSLLFVGGGVGVAVSGGSVAKTGLEFVCDGRYSSS